MLTCIKDIDFATTKNDVLVVIDMQNDFVTGGLGSDEARAIVPFIADFAGKFQGIKFFTKDTHDSNYLNTQEGRFLPIKHCIHGTYGWLIVPELSEIASDATVIQKPTFGSFALAEAVAKCNPRRIFLCGVCTGICDISNGVILKTKMPEVEIYILAPLCACVSAESHNKALDVMRTLQMVILE